MRDAPRRGDSTAMPRRSAGLRWLCHGRGLAGDRKPSASLASSGTPWAAVSPSRPRFPCVSVEHFPQRLPGDHQPFSPPRHGQSQRFEASPRHDAAGTRRVAHRYDRLFPSVTVYVHRLPLSLGPRTAGSPTSCQASPRRSALSEAH